MSLIRTLIQRYWLHSFGLTVGTLYLLLSIGNLLSGLLRSNVNFREVLFNHLLETPGHLKFIFPVACLVASLLSIEKLKAQGELTAILACGHSHKKILWALSQAALLVGAVQFLLLAYLAPLIKSKRHDLIQNPEAKFRNLKGRGLRASTIGSGQIWYKNDSYFFSFETYDKANPTLLGLTAYLYSIPPGKDYALIERVIRSPKASFDPALGQWMAPQARVVRNLHTPGFPKVEDLENQAIPLLETPDDFREIEADITTLNIVKLFYYIKKLSENGINVSEYAVLFLEKFSLPLTCLVFALLPSVLAFYPNRRTYGLAKILTFILAFSIVYWPLYSYFVQMGMHSKIGPAVACFGIPSVFALGLATTFYRHRRLI